MQLLKVKDTEGELCDNPTAIDARVVGTEKAYQFSGNYVQLSAKYGLQCWNKFQPSRKCEDFEVRFCCPRLEVPCDGEWSPWVNRDKPTGAGDIETLQLIRRENPEDIACQNPTKIDVRAARTNEQIGKYELNLEMGPNFGVQCLNAKNNGACIDMKIRFCCEPSKSETKIVGIITGLLPTMIPETDAIVNWLNSKGENINGTQMVLSIYDGQQIS